MNLQKAVYYVKSYQDAGKKSGIMSDLHTNSFILVTIGFLIALISVPLVQLDKLIWFALYPILMSALCGENYNSIFLRSTIVLPFIGLIGAFNPIFDNREAFNIYGLPVSFGWITFFSILIRGLLAMQAGLILIGSKGFHKVCFSFHKLGLPEVLTIQLLMLYRFMAVIMEEGLSLQRAVKSRGYGKKSFPIKLWTKIMGALFIRSIDRSKRIYSAMISRGLENSIKLKGEERWSLKSTFFLCGWFGIFYTLRTVNISQLFFN